MNDYKTILRFWLDGLDDTSKLDVNSYEVRKWFIKDENFDLEIKNRFEEDLNKAKTGEYSFWNEVIDGQLALIILFDQFSRNIYRGTPKMFENDALALELSLQMVEGKTDSIPSLVKKNFVYLPLMHSEDIRIQETAVICYEDLLKDAKQKSPQNTAYFQDTLSFAKKHFEIIKDFGRFPHRNAILERGTTNLEEEFLEQPGSSF